MTAVTEEVEERHENDGVDPSGPVDLETVPESRSESLATAALLTASLSLSLCAEEDLRFR